jgi:hypothetical protein
MNSKNESNLKNIKFKDEEKNEDCRNIELSDLLKIEKEIYKNNQEYKINPPKKSNEIFFPNTQSSNFNHEKTYKKFIPNSHSYENLETCAGDLKENFEMEQEALDSKVKKYDNFKIKSKSSKDVVSLFNKNPSHHHNANPKNSKFSTEIKINNSQNSFSSPPQNLLIYTVTWNMYGISASKKEISKLLPKDNFYHIYAIGTEECMRSILFSFFYTDKSMWEKLAQ